MPQHTHDHLEGTFKVLVNGKPQTMWKTTVAGRYVPAMCRAWAATLRTHAPREAFTPVSRQPMEQRWQTYIMQVAGMATDVSFFPCPICPAEFTSGWEDAISVWSHEKIGVSKPAKKQKTAQNNATAVASGTGIDGSVVGRPLAANVDGNIIDGTIVGRPLAANGAHDTPPLVERLSEEDAMVAGQEMDRRIALALAKQSASADDRPFKDESIKLPVSEREGKTSARVLKRPASKGPA
jgi:hypothetical protein